MLFRGEVGGNVFFKSRNRYIYIACHSYCQKEVQRHIHWSSVILQLYLIHTIYKFSLLETLSQCTVSSLKQFAVCSATLSTLRFKFVQNKLVKPALFEKVF